MWQSRWQIKRAGLDERLRLMRCRINKTSGVIRIRTIEVSEHLEMITMVSPVVLEGTFYILELREIIDEMIAVMDAGERLEEEPLLLPQVVKGTRIRIVDKISGIDGLFEVTDRQENETGYALSVVRVPTVTERAQTIADKIIAIWTTDSGLKSDWDRMDHNDRMKIRDALINFVFEPEGIIENDKA